MDIYVQVGVLGNGVQKEAWITKEPGLPGLGRGWRSKQPFQRVALELGSGAGEEGDWVEGSSWIEETAHAKPHRGSLTVPSGKRRCW